MGAVVLWVCPGCGCPTIKYVILLLSSHAGYLKVVQLRQNSARHIENILRPILH